MEPILISSPTNILFLTGFMGASPQEREAYLLVTQHAAYFFTNSLYLEEVKPLIHKSYLTTTRAIPVHVLEISREQPLSKKLATILDAEKITTLEFEEVNLTYAEFRKLNTELPKIHLQPTQDRIEGLRRIKRPDEITCIRAAAKITDACYIHILTKLRVGMHESQIAWEIESFFRKNAAQSAFSPIVAFGKHASMPHYNSESISEDHNQETILQSLDLVLLDFGAKLQGYCADMTRVVFVGQPKNEWAHAYQTLLTAQTAVIDALKQGERSAARLDELARKELQKHHYPLYPHSLGHGIGLDVHESPRLSIKKDATLTPGMTVTIEPGIYVEGQYGLRIEDLIYIGEHGIEVLSKSPKELSIL